MRFRFDIFSWIPQPDVPNPIAALPGGVARCGPGACGPRFGGDNFIRPPATAAGWSGTFRAKQSLEFQITRFGDAPRITLNTGVVPGVTTVLTANRKAGGTICHSITASVRATSASIKWNASSNWYEVRMHGEAQDPVPAAVGARVAGGAGSSAATALTPNLSWQLDLRLQKGSSIPFLTSARYGISKALSLDVSGSVFPGRTSFGGLGNLVHGLITVRRFPSYAIYTTIDAGRGAVTIPHYFAEASGRNLLEIAVGQTDVLRQLSW